MANTLLLHNIVFPLHFPSKQYKVNSFFFISNIFEAIVSETFFVLKVMPLYISTNVIKSFIMIPSR